MLTSTSFWKNKKIHYFCNNNLCKWKVVFVMANMQHTWIKHTRKYWKKKSYFRRTHYRRRLLLASKIYTSISSPCTLGKITIVQWAELWDCSLGKRATFKIKWAHTLFTQTLVLQQNLRNIQPNKETKTKVH